MTTYPFDWRKSGKVCFGRGFVYGRFNNHAPEPCHICKGTGKMNRENFGLTDEQMMKLSRLIEDAKNPFDDIVPASEAEVEAIEIAYKLHCRIDRAVKVLDQNPGVLSTLIRDLLIGG